jgi:hypothetical protein
MKRRIVADGRNTTDEAAGLRKQLQGGSQMSRFKSISIRCVILAALTGLAAATPAAAADKVVLLLNTFCPMGPVIATGLDPRDLLLETRVNGKVRQSVRTSDLLFSVAELITYISQAVTLLPGDVILTGTPSGVGPIEPGDAVDITIEGIGTLHNPVVAEPALAA